MTSLCASIYPLNYSHTKFVEVGIDRHSLTVGVWIYKQGMPKFKMSRGEFYTIFSEFIHCINSMFEKKESAYYTNCGLGRGLHIKSDDVFKTRFVKFERLDTSTHDENGRMTVIETFWMEEQAWKNFKQLYALLWALVEERVSWLSPLSEMKEDIVQELLTDHHDAAVNARDQEDFCNVMRSMKGTLQRLFDERKQQPKGLNKLQFYYELILIAHDLLRTRFIEMKKQKEVTNPPPQA